MPPKDTGVTYEFYSAVFRANAGNPSLCYVTIYGVNEWEITTIDWNEFNQTRHSHNRALRALGFQTVANYSAEIAERGGSLDGLVLTVKPLPH